MAAHSSVLAWRIPTDRGAWGLQSLGSHRVSHDRAAKHGMLALKTRLLGVRCVALIVSPDRSLTLCLLARGLFKRVQKALSRILSGAVRERISFLRLGICLRKFSVE